MKTIKIGVNATTIDVHGGGGTYIVNILRNLARIDRNNVYYVFISQENKELLDIKQANFVFLYSNIKSRNLFYRVLYEQIVIPLKVIFMSLDIFYFPTEVVPLALRRIKIIVVFQNNQFYVKPFSSAIRGLRKIYFKIFAIKSLRKASRIITVSKSAKQDLVKYCPETRDKTRVVYEGVSSEFYPYNERSRENWLQLKKRYNINNKYVLFVSTLRTFKNADKVIDAYDLVHNRLKGGEQLVIVGNPIEKQYVKLLHKKVAQKKLDKQVVFIDTLSKNDLRLFYIFASVLVYPSALETFGLPPLEAMACGCPVITSNRFAMPEISGDAALIADPDNIPKLAEAIYQVLNNESLRQGLIRKGHERVKQFDWKKAATQTLEIFAEVITG